MSIGASAADRRSATGVRIWLFGDFRVEVDGSVVPPGAWSRSKARALVKVLALAHAHRRHREQLMDELWPALGPTAAAANLRKAIHFARRAVGAEHIVVRHELVELAGSDVWVDVDAFETARRAGDAATAVALYADDLLTEDRYEPWAEERREQLRREFAEVLLEFGRERERRGDWRGAVHVFERLAAVDPLHEDAYCGLLRIHAAQGQRHLALRWYRQLEDRLREEWGTAPGAGVRRLRDAIVVDDEGDDETDDESDGRAALGAETGPRASARGAAREERKLVTVLAAGLRGDARPRSSAARDAVGSLRDAQAAISAEVVEGWGGVHSPVPGGFIAVFGLAATGEADVVHALHTALGLVRELGPAVRIGVDTGVVVAPIPPRSDLQGVVGDTLRIAGSLRASARPGTALVSDRSWRAARAQFHFGPAGQRGRHGGIGIVAREVRSVEPSAPIRPWPNVPMVGRSAELDTLVGLADEVVGRRRPRLVSVVGSVGVGKSRLVAEAVLAVRERRPEFQVWRGRCLSVGEGTTGSALGDILRQACSINLGEPPDHVEARLRIRVGDLLAPLALSDEHAAATIAALAATAGLTNRDDPLTVLGPQAAAAERNGAWARFATATVSTRPAIFLLEDLHWAGDQLIDIIEHLVANADGPLLVVTTARPELFDWRPGFSNRGDASTIALRELSLTSSRELLDLLPPAAVLDPRQRQLVLERADGNPYFLEELLAHVTESDTGLLPDTLRAALAARVDALDQDERIVLQEASVIGRTFWAAALAHSQPGLAVADALGRLERRRLIFVRPICSVDGGGGEYLFHHALLRDAAYAALSDTRRVEAHVAAARWLEQRPAASDELTELIALHYASAAEIGSKADEHREPIRGRAVAGLVAAGASARRRFDIAHAQDLHARALALATTETERLGLYEELGDDTAAGLQGDCARRWYEQALAGARRTATGSAARSRLCCKLASLMAMNPGAFHVSPDPMVVEHLVTEGLEHAPDAIGRAHLLMIKAVSARLWQGSEPFGQGTEHDPVPIAARIAAVDEALEIGKTKELPELVDAATNGLVILHGIAGHYGAVLELLSTAVAHVDRAPSVAAQADMLRTAAVHTIHIEARFEDGLELGRRARALSDGAEPHQLMHALYPIIVALYHLGRWDELAAVVDEHAAAYAREPASACQFVRDGPVVGAIVAAHQGDLARCLELAQLVPDPSDDPAGASAWQSRLATVLGDAAAAIRLSAPKASEGRLYGPQHALALLDAVVEQGAWSGIDTVINTARAAIAGNRLLIPSIERATGLHHASAGRTGSAVAALARAAELFDDLQVPFEAARTREQLAALQPDTHALMSLLTARGTYERLGARPAEARLTHRLAELVPR